MSCECNFMNMIVNVYCIDACARLYKKYPFGCRTNTVSGFSFTPPKRTDVKQKLGNFQCSQVSGEGREVLRYDPNND